MALCRAGRSLKVPKEASLVILLIQEFLCLGSVLNDVVNEKESDHAAQDTCTCSSIILL